MPVDTLLVTFWNILEFQDCTIWTLEKLNNY